MPKPTPRWSAGRRSPLVSDGGFALITGATAGIGNAFARALAGAGHDLVLVARDENRLRQVGGQLRRCGVRVEVIVADLADADDLARVADRVRDGVGPVDLLVNNAGFAVRSRFVGGDLAAQVSMLDVLVRAVMVLSHAAATAMVARGRGTIVTVSSVASFLPGGSYSAAKAWATTFTTSLDVELGGSGVRAITLCPGYVRTEFHERMGLDPGRVAPGWAWLDGDRLVADCLTDAARGRSVSIPGRRYRTAVMLARALPLRALPALGRRAQSRRHG